MRHCHLYPVYSWQDILLTFAEMELDSTTMFTHVMFICSTQEPVLAQVVGNHHPRVLPKAFQWKVVSMFRGSRFKWSRPKKFYTEPVKW